jgi:macrolide-specific efflux system membrane fusion protein
MNIQDKFRDPKPANAPVTPRKPTKTLGRANRRPVLIAAIAAVLLLGAGYAYWSRSTTTSDEPVLATAMRGDVEDVVTAVGSLTPLTSVDVGAQVTGQLEKLHVMIGDDVMKGQLLAEIDAKVTAAKVDADTAQLQNYQAQLLQRQSDLALAEAQADRQTRLMRDNATSQDAFDVAQATAKSAQAQVKSVQAQISQAQSTLKADQATLGYSKIYAPMAGTVTAMPAKEGQTLNANQTAPLILTIADLSTMTVSTQVSEADVPKLAIGMDAYFTTLGDPNRRWMGKLRQILPTPTVVNNVVLYTALFDVSNPNKILMPQMTAQVFFVRGAAHDAVLVPVAALQYGTRGQRAAGAAGDGAGAAPGARAGRQGGGAGRRGGGRRAAGGDNAVRQRPATVTVVKDDGTHEIRNVVVGVSDRVNAEIVSGLQEGEKVVAGTNQAAPGARQGGRALGQQGGRFGPGRF